VLSVCQLVPERSSRYGEGAKLAEEVLQLRATQVARHAGCSRSWLQIMDYRDHGNLPGLRHGDVACRAVAGADVVGLDPVIFATALHVVEASRMARAT
jgi:hypothetical protein